MECKQTQIEHNRGLKILHSLLRALIFEGIFVGANGINCTSLKFVKCKKILNSKLFETTDIIIRTQTLL